MSKLNVRKILHLDINHPLIIKQLNVFGYINDIDYNSTKKKIEDKIANYYGLIIRSRFKIDKHFIDKALNLKFIARVGAGLESIDFNYAKQKNIHLIAAPEGNSNAVGEHTLALILSLFNNLNVADTEMRLGIWNRESNRGFELENKTIGIIGYGNMGKSFAKKLRGFDCKVIFYDIKKNIGDENATQVSLSELQNQTDVLSLHIPWTPETDSLVDLLFINNFEKAFWIINTSRGKNVVTSDLVIALKSGKILGAGLDVLEFENLSFENLNSNAESLDLEYLRKAKNVLLTPHIAGWTFESEIKLAQVIVEKIKLLR